MKNKHLVLLFLSVLVVGLLVRVLPVRYRTFFHTELIRVDTATLTQCVIQAPGQPELTLERTERGWTADQDRRTAAVPHSDMTALLDTLAGIYSLRSVKTSLADTLGFTREKIVRIRLFRDTRLVEQFELGAEIRDAGQTGTYLRLPLHDGVYLVRGHLRRLFDRTLDDFRSRVVTNISPDEVHRITLRFQGSAKTAVFEKNDSTKYWESLDGQIFLAHDSVQTWLGLFNRLDNSPFADNFDESQAAKSRIAEIRLESQDKAAQSIQFFYLKPPDAPEDLSALRRKQVRALPVYVFHSSANPMNYFAATDTNLVRFLCFGLWQAPPKTDMPDHDKF